MKLWREEMDGTFGYMGHDHSLVFVEDPQICASEYCGCCKESTKGTPTYCCSSLTTCKFFIHKSCMETELPPMDYAFHDHPIILIPKDFGFLDSTDYYPSCSACKKPIVSLPFYRCFDCEYNFSLHKECAELPLKINHPYDRLHPLSLFPNPVSHRPGYCSFSCYSCKFIKWDGHVYRCSPCNIELTLEDVSAPPTIPVSDTTHQHPWTLVPCPISFTCDFCGLEGDRTPYICTTCNLVVHRRCTSLPRAIRIARHRHPISHVYNSLQQSSLDDDDDDDDDDDGGGGGGGGGDDDDERLYEECRICYEKVMGRYGSYFCSAPNCNYIAHVHCATDRKILDGSVVHEGDEMSNEFDLNMITRVISEVKVGEDVMAMEIKHAFHHRHNLMLSFKDQIMDDNICNGCVRPISSTHFYNCKKCSFFLHKSCAELPRVTGHPLHKHLLKLQKSEKSFLCDGCGRFHDGFVYTCEDEDCDSYFRGGFKLDIQCSLLPDSLKHPSHEQHRLCLSLGDYIRACRGCPQKSFTPAYRCTKGCNFIVDVACLTLPETVKYKYDRHPLTLAYDDKSDPNQVYCDVCEEKRDSDYWFYYCAHCDTSAHQECALGPLPFIQIGSTYNVSWHEHGHLTFVDNIWNCPPCNRCGEICYRQVLKCEECNYTVHGHCRRENELRI